MSNAKTFGYNTWDRPHTSQCTLLALTLRGLSGRIGQLNDRKEIVFLSCVRCSFDPDCAKALNPLHVYKPSSCHICGSRIDAGKRHTLSRRKGALAVAPRTTPTTYHLVNSLFAVLVILPLLLWGYHGISGTPVGDFIHRRALSSANRPGDPYHHPLGAMNPQSALLS